MSPALTVRLTDELLAWLKETSRLTDVPVGRLIRQHLESAKSNEEKQRFLRHVGAISGGFPIFRPARAFREDEATLRSFTPVPYKISIPHVGFALLRARAVFACRITLAANG
jgi:hypothetical protein